MEDISDMLNEITGGGSMPDFKPVAYYDRKMDALMYVNTDCSYKAERIGAYVTILWHPDDENRPVGLKLKGFSLVFGRLVNFGAIEESEFESFISWFKLVLAITAEEQLEEIKAARLQQARATLMDEAKHVMIPREQIEALRQAA